MHYCCPSCNGEDVRKLSVVYNSGVSDLNISGDYIGFGRSNWGYVQANGKQVSRLAQSCSPPQKFSFIYFVVLIAFAVAWCPLAELGTEGILGAIYIAYLFIKSTLYAIVITFFNTEAFNLSTDPIMNWLAEDNTWKATVSIPIVLALAGWMLVFMWQYNHTTWVQEYRKWENSFMCLRCGTKFHVR